METPSPFSRERQVQRLESEPQPWDIVVIGGGATGLGIAVDAATRGYRVALFEQHDFGKGTSSRSTKLIHGGLRYLQQGRIGLVRDALRERGRLCQNAPHLVHPLPTIVPLHSKWEVFYYGLGLKVYDALSGRWRLRPSQRLNLSEALARIPTLEPAGLCGGVMYFDGVFDDARLVVNLVQTAIEAGAVCLNYAPVRELMKESGRVAGVLAEDLETGKTLRVGARVVVSAAGPFSDKVARLDNPQSMPMIVPSQGIHLVFDRQFLPGDTALVVPKTRDGRVVFAVPWHDHTVVGTTDTPLDCISLEPQPLPAEIDFILQTISPYWSRKPRRGDIRSIFAGIRPLVRSGDPGNTAKLARDHLIRVSATGLVSIMGGKWTTYRKMAEECVDRAAEVVGLLPRPCCTKTLPIHGAKGNFLAGRLAGYGTDGPAIRQLASSRPDWDQPLTDRLPDVAAQVIWAARHEMARTVEDVLARRMRALFLDSEIAIAAAPRVASLLAAELDRDAKWQAEQVKHFIAIAQGYCAPAASET